MMVEGVAVNAVTSMGYSKTLGDLDLTECMVALVQETRKVQGGNLASLAATLAAPAVTLNAMFTQLVYLASKMTVGDQIDRFTRLALKAQGQCRATVETLALIKNPPTTLFARQANIASGPQQVNNGGLPPAPSPTPSHAGTLESEPIRILETHGERLDYGTPNTTGRGDQAMAAVAARHRPAHR